MGGKYLSHLSVKQVELDLETFSEMGLCTQSTPWSREWPWVEKWLTLQGKNLHSSQALTAAKWSSIMHGSLIFCQLRVPREFRMTHGRRGTHDKLHLCNTDLVYYIIIRCCHMSIISCGRVSLSFSSERFLASRQPSTARISVFWIQYYLHGDCWPWLGLAGVSGCFHHYVTGNRNG